MKKLIKVLVVLIVLVALVAAGFVFGPKIVYSLPPFQSWVKGQIEKQSGGSFDFSSIQGDLSEANLNEAALRFETAGESNLVAVEMTELQAGFKLLPVATLRLQLTELHAQGGVVHLKLAGGDVSLIRFPVNASVFKIENGILRVENIHGYTFELQGMTLSAQPEGEGMSGSFSGPVAAIGNLKLQNVAGQFTFSAGKLTVSNFTAMLPGNSKLALEGGLSLNENQPLEGVQIHVKSADVAALLQALGYSSAFGGQATVDCEVSGFHRPELKNLNGKGTYELSQVTAQVGLPNYPGFNEAGILKKLQRIEALKGEGSFRLDGGRILVDEFNVMNDQMEVTGKLNFGLDKSLSGDMNFFAHPDLESDFPSVVRGLFDRSSKNWIIVPFNFSGTTDQPKVETGSMITKALTNPVNVGKGAADAVESIGKSIFGIFGGGSKKDEEKEE
jgi:hypothetical protein